KVCATQVNLVDIAPTVLDNANLLADPTLPGRSLVAIAHEKDDPERIGFSEYHAVGSPSAAYLVRQRQWAYHHYVGYEPELFDMAADPGQIVNLAVHDGHRPIREHMVSLLNQMLDPEATDQRAKADQDALVARFGGREAALGKGPMGASPVPLS
ncbi:sulfatase/phosphatase domain-containing protein, partial [Limnohabitans sp. Rim8]|uniref:sulfatase/phosphatase domain-containing protein n=1 Tax=Limnohabitans sp. Rim8 TaxID=1100718 RepID=UPI00345C314C